MLDIGIYLWYAVLKNRKGESDMKKYTRPEWVQGEKWVGNVHYTNFHPSGRMITCVVTGEWSDGTKVWSEVDADGNEIFDAQYMLGGKGKKETQAFYKVCVG